MDTDPALGTSAGESSFEEVRQRLNAKLDQVIALIRAANQKLDAFSDERRAAFAKLNRTFDELERRLDDQYPRKRRRRRHR
jgi:hypothetical protein